MSNGTDRTAFLSHKVKDGELAKQIRCELKTVFPSVTIFLSEEIKKSKDFRNEISNALTEASFFILLYTDPSDDWSWCFYEVGCYRSLNPRLSDDERPVYCLHSEDVPPPGPIANLQTTKSDAADIRQWIGNIASSLKQKAPSNRRVTAAAKKIERAIKARSILVEQVIKPYIWITPPWPGPHPKWTARKLPAISLENALVTIDKESATQLGFAVPKEDMGLLEFLQRLDCDRTVPGADRAYWIERFFDSLTKALDGNLRLQEVAYFRHEDGGIYRPVVVSVAKSKDGASCRLRVLFAHAFGVPLTDNPTPMQRLASGVRLGVRTRLEVIEAFSGKMSRIFQEKVMSVEPADEIARNYPVGRRLRETMDAIVQEARAHGLRIGGETPSVFASRNDQAEYERIREKSISILKKLNVVSKAEDDVATGKYDETEKLLLNLKEVNDRYLAFAIPRLDTLLRSPE